MLFVASIRVSSESTFWNACSAGSTRGVPSSANASIIAQAVKSFGSLSKALRSGSVACVALRCWSAFVASRRTVESVSASASTKNGTAFASPCSARFAIAVRRTPLGCVASVNCWMCCSKDDIFVFLVRHEKQNCFKG